MNGWTPERRLRQAEAIKAWKPWEASTGPRSADGKARVARNAWRGGHRQQLRELARQLSAEILVSRELLKTVSRIKNG